MSDEWIFSQAEIKAIKDTYTSSGVRPGVCEYPPAPPPTPPDKDRIKKLKRQAQARAREIRYRNAERTLFRREFTVGEQYRLTQAGYYPPGRNGAYEPRYNPNLSLDRAAREVLGRSGINLQVIGVMSGRSGGGGPKNFYR